MAALHDAESPVRDEQSSNGYPEKGAGIQEETAHEAAERGHVATDKYGKPLVHFDPEAERRLRWKIDLYVLPTVALLYLFCFIDRSNIGNAKIAGLAKDLKLKGNDYNIVLTAFYVSYILFEIPSNIVCKIVGPGWYIPTLTLGFGIISVCTGFTHNRAQAAGVRFLLGIFEAGMMPGIAYYLSRWYRRSELAFRLSMYIVTAPLSGAFGGLLASGILKLNHFGSMHGWRMLFGIEGIITIGLSVIAYFTMTDRPSTARWLSKEEKELAIARIKSERVATTEVLDKIDRPKIARGIFSPVTLTTAFIFLLNNVTVQGLAFFLPTIIATIYPHHSVIYQQVKTVPPYVVGAFFTVLFPFLAWKTDRRNLYLIISAPLMVVGYIIFLATTNAHARYGATFLIAAGAYSYGALCNAQVSANVVSDSARAAAISTNVMFGNIGGLISTWSFLASDAPNYHIGNGLNLATSALTTLTAIGLMIWMYSNNKAREKRDVDAELAGLDQKAIQDLDWKHPSFRWKP